MRALTVIDDEMLASMVRDTRYRTLIPCLNVVYDKMQKNKAACGRCKKQVKVKQNELLEQARNCLREMPVSQRSALKQQLQTQKYRLKFRNASGVLMSVTY